MSSKQKKSAATGVRYTDAQKQEIVSFVVSYNKENGRGGQNKAAAKFNVSPLTVSSWLKANGKSGAAAPKKAAAPAKASKSAGNTKMGVRYSPEKKQEVVDFVASYNAENGRGGQNQAASKFDLSVLTVSAWLKAAGQKGAKGAAKPAQTVKPAKAAKAVKAAKTSDKPVSELEALKAAIRALIN